MPRSLLDTALAHAERADPRMQAAIWLRAARVMTPLDRPEAERLLQRGIAAARVVEAPDREPLITRLCRWPRP